MSVYLIGLLNLKKNVNENLKKKKIRKCVLQLKIQFTYFIALINYYVTVIDNWII